MDSKTTPPKAVFSYSWDSAEHRQWVVDLATRLRVDGIDVVLDDWHVQPGDQLPRFMESAVRESDFVLIVCTPRYKEKSDERLGGVGYEGNIITAELLAGGSERKFIPLLKEGEWQASAPSWLLGKFYIDFRGDPYSEASYEQLRNTLHGLLPVAPLVRSADRGSGRRLSPKAVTRQVRYTEFMNEAIKVFHTANKKFVLYKHRTSVAKIMRDRVDAELEAQASRVNKLLQEIHMFSSEPVGRAAGEIAGWVLAAKISSMLPTGEEKFKEMHGRFLRESIPKFRDAVRFEAGLR